MEFCHASVISSGIPLCHGSRVCHGYFYDIIGGSRGFSAQAEWVCIRDVTRLLEQAHAQTKVQEAEEDEELLHDDDEVIVEEDPAMQASCEISALGS